MKKFEKLSSEELIKNKFVTIKKNKFKSNNSDNPADFYVMEFPNWVNIVPVTKDMEIILVKQFRIGIEDFCLEIPGGTTEVNEEPEIAAKRELKEETGYESKELILLNKVSSNPAHNNNFIYGYLAPNVELITEQNLDEHEEIEIVKVPIDQVADLIKKGEIHHPFSILFLMYSLNRYRIKYDL